MQSLLIILGTFVIGMALRSCKAKILRRLGALTYLLASAIAVYLVTDSIWLAILVASIWFFLPWLELLTCVRKLRLPLNNQLNHCYPPNEDLFPNCDAIIAALENAGFEHAENSGWDWAETTQCHQFFWHPEERAVAAVCFCKQAEITFSFLTIYSRDTNDILWYTTNYPFSQTLKEVSTVWQNRISCKNTCITRILASHHYFISLHGACHDDLIIPDLDTVAQDIEQDMCRQIDHNLQAGIIILTDDGHFKYSFRGLFFLWKQFIKDMIRLC